MPKKNNEMTIQVQDSDSRCNLDGDSDFGDDVEVVSKWRTWSAQAGVNWASITATIHLDFLDPPMLQPRGSRTSWPPFLRCLVQHCRVFQGLLKPDPDFLSH